MKKRLLAAIMSLCMIVSLLPVSALAYESADMSEERNRSITMQIGETHQMTDAHEADNRPLYEDHIWSAEPAGYVAFGDSYAHRPTITALKAGTVTITHRYWQKSGILGLDGDYEVENWTVNIVRNTEIYFFLLKPGEYTIESDQGNDYYYLLHGGQVTDRAADLEEEVPEIDLVNESTIKDYVKSWPTGGFDTGNDEMSSDPVESGSTWSLGNNGTVSSFTLVLKDTKTQETTKYSSNPGDSTDGNAYGIRWVKIGYVGNDGTESGNKYHLDGVLYKKVLAQEVLEKGLYKEFVANSHPSLDGDGNPQAQETFQFILDAANDTADAFEDIPLTATVSTNSVALNFNDTSDATQELPVGDYVVREILQGEQEKAWETPNSIEFSVNSNGSITFVNNTQTITNTLETYTLSYDAGAGTGAPTGGTYKYNEKTSVSADKPTQEGYEFQGWDSGDDGDVDYKAGADIQITEDVKLVAVWKELEALSIKKSVALVKENGTTTPLTSNDTVKKDDKLLYTVTVTNKGSAVKDVIVFDTKFPMDTTGEGVKVNPSDNITWSYGSATISEMGKDQTVTFTYYDTVDAEDELVGCVENTAVVYLGQQDDAHRKGTASTKVPVTKTYTLTYNKGVAPEGTVVPTDTNQYTYNQPVTLSTNKPTWDGCAFIGWTLNESAANKVYTAGDELPEVVTSVKMTENTTVYAVWGYDEVVVTPADITIYTGGTGYSGVIGENNTEINNPKSGLPEPGYYITLPKTLNDALLEQLGEESGTVLDLSKYVTFTYENGSTKKNWTLEPYDPDGHSQDSESNYIYRLVAGEEQDPVRLLITGGSVATPVVSDQFDISLNSALFREYDMTIYSGDVNSGLVKLTVKNDTTLGELAGTSYTVEVKSGKLTIRGTTAEAQQATVGSKTQNGFSADVALPEGSSGDVEYYVNGSEIQVQNGDIHLLVDSLVTEGNNGDQAVVNAIQDKVQEALKENHPENAAYDMRYLNLVDNNNGNAYVTTNGETTVTWPIPDDAAEGSTFHVVHFKDLDREFNGSEAVDKINAAQTEELDAKVVDGAIQFTTSTFSPFALVYEKKEPTPTPTTYTITATAGTGGSISPSGAVTVNDGANRTFTITPASGYAISDVQVDGRSVGAVSSYPFTNVTANHTIHASFYWVGTGGGSGSGGGHDSDDSDPTGNLSIELDVNGGDDEFTFTVILTDRDGDDLENNFYYNGDYTGTIGSGDEITLEGGDKIVIRNLPEGTRYEVIIETADGYTYVIDGEEGVIHTGMNEAEFTATRTVPVADPSVTGVSRWLNTTDHIAYLTGYPGGAFGPDNNMTRAEVAQMFYALLNNKNVTITKTFPDVPADAWYATAVNTLASLGMVSGDEHGNYRPNDPITRAEFCVIALAFAYEPENAVCYFGDVSRSDWFYTYVAQAASYGWIGGYTNGNFGPNDRITRAQVTTIVNNMLGRAADRDYVIDHQADLVQFTDLTRAHWGYFQIMEATNAHDYTKSNGTENWR